MNDGRLSDLSPPFEILSLRYERYRCLKQVLRLPGTANKSVASEMRTGRL